MSTMTAPDDDGLSNRQRSTASASFAKSSRSKTASKPTTSSSEGMFHLDPFRSKVSRGLGDVVGLAACGSSLWVATSKNYLIRYEESSGRVQERRLNCVTVKKLLAVDESHLLVTVHDGRNLETLCVRAEEMARGRPLVVKGLQGRYLTSAVRCGSRTVIGSDTGILYGSSSPAGPFVKLIEIPQRHKRRSPVSGLTSIEHGGELVLLVLCGTCLQCFTMTRHDAWFEDGVKVRPIELPIEQDAAQLQAGGGFGGSETAFGDANGLDNGDKRVAVLSTSGVYVGEFPGLETLQAEPIAFSCGPGDALPMLMAMTMYHIVLLYPTKVQFVNVVSREVVQEVLIEGSVMGLSRDVVEGRLFLLAGDDVYEIDFSDEDTDMWRVYLVRGMYDQALPLCRTAQQRNAVYLAQAEALFEREEYVESARLYGKITAMAPSFDDVAWRFLRLGSATAGVSSGDSLMRPLREFLASKLSTLGDRDVMQRAIISTWLLELLVQADECADVGELDDHVAAFLTEYADCLHPRTTASILESHGRTDDLLTYSRARKDDEAELELLIRAGEVLQAIGVLRKPDTSLALVVKYAAPMIASAPVETVSLWMDILRSRRGRQSSKTKYVTAVSPAQLDPLVFLPAMAPYISTGASREIRSQILRFVNFAIDLDAQGGPDESADGLHQDLHQNRRLEALYDLNISLLSVDDENEDLLLEKIAHHRGLYDPLRALRLCSERGRMRAVTALLVHLGSWEDAVQRSLSLGDTELARSIARRCTNRDLRKRLFLDIVQTLLNAEDAQISTVADILAESDFISINDVLGAVSSDVRIGDFKDLIRTDLRASAAKTRANKIEIAQADAVLHGIAMLDPMGTSLDADVVNVSIEEMELTPAEQLIVLLRQPFVGALDEVNELNV